MKQIAVSKIPYGETFCVFGDRFVALDRSDGGVLAIRRDIWKKVPFDSDGKNNLKIASINSKLSEYMLYITDNGSRREDLISQNVDLKATDGTREYGFFKIFVALLTLEQYGKYQHIIPDVDNEWWLATPHMTPRQKNGNALFTWYVNRYGFCFGNCRCNNGIRPAPVFAPSLLVEYDDGDGETGGTDGEETIYDDYLEYVDLWIMRDSDKRELGASPLSYEAWKAASGKPVSG